MHELRHISLLIHAHAIILGLSRQFDLLVVPHYSWNISKEGIST